MESSDFTTSSFRNKQNCRASYTKSKRRNVSRIIAVWIGRKVVVRFHQMLMLSAKCARTHSRRKNNSVWKKICGIIRRSNYSIRRISGITPKIRKVKVRIHQCGKKVSQWIFIGYALIATGIWKGDVLIADIEELDKLDASEINFRRLNAKEVLIYQKDGEFVFPVTNNFHSRWFHLSSSCWIESSIVCVERRIIPDSTEVYWCNEINSYRSGCGTRKTNWWFLECRRK